MAKATRTRGTRPWGGLAKELIRLGVPAKDAEQRSWLIWFETKCPKCSYLFEKNPEENDECLKELYEQTSGRYVESEDEDDDDDEEDDANDDQRTSPDETTEPKGK